MAYTATYLVDASSLAFDENTNASWVHALPIGNYKHPLYGTISVTAERAKRFAESVTKKVRGIDLSINYVHDNDNVAAGWVKDAQDRADGVWLFVEWVKDAAQAIRDKKWRYFSAEFKDEWEDSTGKKFTDVIFGGALTNRPFMKNLVPINLSEQVYENAYDLVSTISGINIDSLKGGNSVSLSDEDIAKVVTKLKEELVPKAPTPPATDPAILSMLDDNPELKTLAESNPLVKALITAVEVQKRNIVEGAKKLKEQQIEARLAEFDRSKIVLTPTSKERVVSLLDKMPTELHEDFWKLLSEMRSSSTFLVELGERAGATINYGIPKSAVKQFNELAASIAVDRKITESDAFEAAAAENRDLYKAYRNEIMSGEVVK